jgi:hypothetical protein
MDAAFALADEKWAVAAGGEEEDAFEDVDVERCR